MAFRILCTGDVHLGRPITRVPDRIERGAVGPRGAWDRFVERAIEDRVHAAVLTGDVADESNRFFEAYSALASRVRRLVDRGIPVLGVAGNHDHEVLGRLADEIEGFRLLGRGGTWEATTIEGDGETVRFVGWSFPQKHVASSPMESFEAGSSPSTTVGLLHCDCEEAGSHYAPVGLAELRASGIAAWLLGHIHRPRLHSEPPDGPLVLYPGSPQGLDPSETGPHGPWLVTIDAEDGVRASQLPLAELRWERIELALDGIVDEGGFERALVSAVRRRHEEIAGETSFVRTVGCRVELTGRTALHPHLPRLIDDLDERFSPEHDGVVYLVERVIDRSAPDLPVDEWAASDDPLGLLARRIQLLETGEPRAEFDELIARASLALGEVRGAPAFVALDDATEESLPDELREKLLRAAYFLLESLVAQKEQPR